VVFSGGQHALQILPPLIDIIPEARLNLAIYYLTTTSTGANDNVSDADAVLSDIVSPKTTQECILKAVVHAVVGQQQRRRQNAIGGGGAALIRAAQTLFRAVGSRPSECDTIPGRQCMASAFFLAKQFDDVVIYLQSVKSYMSEDDDDFHWNYGVALTATGNYKAGQETLLLVRSSHYRTEVCYLMCLSRCYIMNNQPQNAWGLYNAIRSQQQQQLMHTNHSDDCFQLLQLIANDCYRMGHFLIAARAFCALADDADIDEEENYVWEGLRGACVGYFQKVVALKEREGICGKDCRENLKEVVEIMEGRERNPQLEFIIDVIRKWAKENDFRI